MRTTVPRLGVITTSRSACSLRSASRIGVRLTLNRSHSSSCRSRAPGGNVRAMIAAWSRKAISSARLVVSSGASGNPDGSRCVRARRKGCPA